MLRQPYPGHANFRVYFKSILGISVIVFMILSIFQPFNMGDRKILENQFLTASIYAAGSFLTALISYAWIKIFPDFFKNENWNIGKEVILFLYQLVTISSTIWLINTIRGISSPNVLGYFAMLLQVTSVGMLPYLIVMLIRHTYFLKRRLRKATMMNIGLFLDKEPANSAVSEHVSIDESVDPVDVRDFVSANGRGEDYIVVNIVRNGNLEELIVGNTLSDFESENSHFDQLFKCNDFCIVNVNRILWVEGNAAGYKLSLHPNLPPIAVANDKKEEFKKFMEVLL